MKNIIKTNVLTNCQVQDWTINVTFRVKNPPPQPKPFLNESKILCAALQVADKVLTRKNALPPGSHFHEGRTINTRTLFELIQCKIRTNVLTKFHEDCTVNVSFRVLTRKMPPPPGGHVFRATRTIFKLVQDIIRTNLLTKFHDERTINVLRKPYKENCPASGGDLFQQTETIF
ncbi:hypothetical protein DPMN_157893 [Dreissena polymorpha]|uniref:Uncharacterized protein n=1 Tax=Dreissena polymorpha TaxID=45954 RepID=A0A9D4EI58_DREPO|nr:hypothetical protein DPMN_157893 [Dreissena polymorpha]